MDEVLARIDGWLGENDWFRSADSELAIETTESAASYNDDDDAQKYEWTSNSDEGSVDENDRIDEASEVGSDETSPVCWGQVCIFIVFLAVAILSSGWLDWIEEDGSRLKMTLPLSPQRVRVRASMVGRNCLSHERPRCISRNDTTRSLKSYVKLLVLSPSDDNLTIYSTCPRILYSAWYS